MPFLDCAGSPVNDGNLSVKIYRKHAHTDQYLLFDFHHPVKHKLRVIRTLQDRPQKVPSSTEGKQREWTHIETALQACGEVK